LFFREKGVKIYGSFDTKFTYYVTPSNMEDKRRYKHPTIKPLTIVKNLITNSSMEGELVFDPFLGSGTTGVAAKELGRDFIGCEISDEYIKIARTRIEGREVQEYEQKMDKQPEKISNEYIQGELF
jgi:DNA modification methylase